MSLRAAARAAVFPASRFPALGVVAREVEGVRSDVISGSGVGSDVISGRGSGAGALAANSRTPSSVTSSITSCASIRRTGKGSSSSARFTSNWPSGSE
eukprot:2616459-Prymnesium_polylepis.1